MKNKFIKTYSGFSTVEIILSIALFSMLVLALASAMAFGVQQQKQNAEDVKANFILEEAIEAVANIQLQSFTNLSVGAHGLTTGSGNWAFSGTSDVVDGYTRSVTVSTVDTNTVDALLSVNWQSGLGRSRSIQVTQRLANYYRTVTPTSTWTAPVQTSQLNLTGTNTGFHVGYSGTTAYLLKTNGTPDVVAVDFANPLVPSMSGTISLQGYGYDMDVSGNFAYFVSSQTNREIQIANLTTLTTVGNFNVTGSTNTFMRVDYDNGYMYVTRGGSGVTTNQFQIYDVTTPTNVILRGNLSFPSTVTLGEVVVSGNYAYIATSADNGELAVVDVTSKTAPQYKVGLDLSGTANGARINILSNTVFLGRTGDTNVYAINVGSPLSPSLLSSIDVTGIPSSFAFGAPNNNLMFVANSNVNKDLQVVNISNLNAMSIVGFNNPASALNSVDFVPSSNKLIGASSNASGEFVLFSSN